MSEQLDIQTLGRFRVIRGDTPIPDNSFGTHRAKTLLKVLLTHYSQSLTRDQIIDWVWQDVPPENATRALYTAVSDLRRVLEPNLAKPADSTFILSTDEGYRFNSEAPNLTLDKQVFAQHIEAARKDASGHSLEVAGQTYLDSETLYAGDYLPDDIYADWSIGERERLRTLFLTMLLESGEVQAQLGRYREATTKCRRALELDNCLEAAYRALMLYYHSAGERPQALRVYSECQVILQRELGVEPMAETTSLFQSIKESASAFTEKPITNLPIALTSFIGRKREMAQLKKSLAKTRLLTLTGAGGSGKTRLALQVASELIDTFKDGVWWVELAALNDESLVTRAVAKVLGVFEQAQQPLNETLQNYLHSRQLLLVLDNCEHLIQACAQLADDLLRASPHLKVLATSREALGLTGEMIWQVPLLSLPDVSFAPPSERLMQYEAIHLFVERAVAVNQHFLLTPHNAPAVMQVCTRLDGMPLAVELAAARVKTLSPEQIAARLDDRFSLLTSGSRSALARHQTLRATIDWSYDLLPESECLLLRRLSVFAGGWTLEGAIAVCADGGLSGNAMLDLLTHLVDKSLVVVEHEDMESRYGMLETIRQYALEKLLASGEFEEQRNRHLAYLLGFAEAAEQYFSSAEGRFQLNWLEAIRRYALEKLQASGEFEEQRNRHLAYFLGFAEATEQYFSSAEGRFQLNRLETEHDNLRAAFAWCSEHDVESGLRFGVSLWQFWILRGYLIEGRQWLENLLARAPARTTLRAQALESLSKLHFRLAEPVSSLEIVTESLSIYQELGDKEASSRVHQAMGGIWIVMDEFARAQDSLGESLRLADEAGCAECRALSIHLLGVVAVGVGEYDRAQKLFEESLVLLRALPDEPNICSVFTNLRMPIAKRDFRHAQVELEETIVLLRGIGTKAAIGYVLANLGQLARQQADYVRARELLEMSLAEFREISDQMGISQVLGQLGNLAKTTGNYRQAHDLLESSLVLRRGIGDQRGIGRTIHNLADLAIIEGDLVRARALLGEGAVLFQKMSDKPGMAASLISLGNLAIAEGNYVRAESMYEKGIAIYREFRVKHAVVILLLNLALCARLQGNRPLERARLEESLVIYQKIGYRPGVDMLANELRNLDHEPE